LKQEEPTEPYDVKDPYDPKQVPSSSKKAVTCTFCKHDYLFPCNGENDDCMNKKFILEKKKGKRK
jgi:hypothetical protein